MKRVTIVMAVLATVAAACGGNAVDVTGSTSATSGSTSATAAPGTTQHVTTSTTGSAPTTTASDPDTGMYRAVLSSFENERKLTAARIEGFIEFVGLSGEGTGITDGSIRFGTAFNEATGDSSFLMDMSAMAGAADIAPEDDPLGMAAGFLGETEFRTIGDRVYVKFPFLTALLGAETPWVSMPEEDGSEFTSESGEFPQNPNEILEAYGDADGTIENLGEEDVNGVKATHYRVLLDADTMRLTAEERTELEESGLFAAGEIPMDLWVTDDAWLVRMIFEIAGTGLDVPPEEQFERMTMRYDVFEINGDVRIETPPADQVTPIEDLDPFGPAEG